MRDITPNLIASSMPIKAAMQQLDQGVDGILLCVNAQNALEGVLTDGDIRRALLKGANLSDKVEAVMNRSFVKGDTNATREKNLQLLGSVVRHVPIVDSNERPVDLVSWSELWRLPVTTPSLAGNELKYVADCIETVWISSQGSYIEKFQDAFSDYHGGGMALCTSSGTAALHLALLALEIGPGDEVIIPNITFGACANVVLHVGARPVFVDIDPITKTLDIDKIPEVISPHTKAIMAVHLYGHPCDMDPLIQLAQQNNLKIIEDCAEALGAEYKGEKVGLIGDVGCFSFFANKVITTGEGGMVLTKDAGLIDQIALYRDHGMTKERRYWHVVPGFNYRMTNLQAAVGLAQLERIEHFLSQRDQIVETYNRHLSKIHGLHIPTSASWARNIHWLYSIEIDPESLGISRNELARRLEELGVETRPVFSPLHHQPIFKTQNTGFPKSEHFAAHGLSLPTGNTLSIQDTERVCEAIQFVYRKQLRSSGTQ